MHDIRYNPINDEILVPNPFSNAILTFRGGADGQEAPVRIIQGPNTELSGPDRLDIDVVNREIFVPGRGNVLVFPLDGNGDVKPKRVVRGPDTQIDGSSIAVDSLNNLFAVTGRERSILVFDRTANGNVKPLHVIKGPNTQIDRINQMAIYPPKREIIAAMPGEEDLMEPPTAFLGVWTYDDNGDIAPKYKIPIGPKTTLKKPFGVVINPKNKEVIISDMRQNGVLTFSVPEIF